MKRIKCLKEPPHLSKIAMKLKYIKTNVIYGCCNSVKSAVISVDWCEAKESLGIIDSS